MELLDVIRLQQLKTTAPRDEPPQCSQKTHHRHVWNHLFLSSPLLYTPDSVTCYEHRACGVCRTNLLAFCSMPAR
ncbi:hypothetical protein T02_8156 [Trichinella nativa]|uniref:Uncharacterized protein n=1 Tax=Trichinella nativa TaxID=6335 RepID=A0A0V1KWD1_9BILA|nr:hypothetical protein T02_8156 [Trichinella nativa]